MQLRVSKTVSVLLLSLILVGLAVEVLPVNGEAAWLEDYSYRRLFFLSCNSTQSNYAAPLTVINQTGFDSAGTAYIYNEAQVDFEDLRITESDGVTLLPIWNQTTNNGANCTVWAKYLLTNTTYWLYWGNTEATAAWNQTAVFPLGVISGVVGAWNMEETSGTNVRDYSGNNNNGTATDASIIDSPFFAGKKARQLNGTTGKISFTDNASLRLGNADFTILEYVKVTAASARNRYLIDKALDNNSGWSFRLNSALTLAFHATAGVDINSVSAVTLNQASLVGLSFNSTAGKYKFIIDGSYGGEMALAAPTELNKTLNIGYGAWSGTTDPYNGIVGPTLKFSIQLTPTQLSNIAANYPDVSLEAGKVLVRPYTYPEPAPSQWGSTEAAPADLTSEDAVGVAVAFGVMAIGVCCALIVMKRRE